MKGWLLLGGIALLALVPTTHAQQPSCFGAYDFQACEQAHHDPGIAVLGGAAGVAAVATGVAIAGPTLVPWARRGPEALPLEEEGEAEPTTEDEPLADPFDGRVLPTSKDGAWWHSAWEDEEKAEAHVEAARRAITDRERQRADFAKGAR